MEKSHKPYLRGYYGEIIYDPIRGEEVTIAELAEGIKELTAKTDKAIIDRMEE